MTHSALTPGAVAVVTGGAAGIGLAAAKRFAQLGLRVCIADLGQDRLARAAAEIGMLAANGADDVIHILDRASGQVLSKFGRPGNQSGDLTDPHSIAVNSKGDIIVGEVPYGGKLQMWRAVRN